MSEVIAMARRLVQDREGLLRAILEDPDDDLPRLLLADWLEEHQDIRGRRRTRLIRAQLLRGGELAVVGLGRGWAAEVLASLGLRPELERLALMGVERVVYRRGFVDEVEMACGDLLKNALALFSGWPLLDVFLTDRLPHVCPRTGTATWFDEGSGASQEESLPPKVFSLVPATLCIGKAFRGCTLHGSKGAALVAASVACVRLGRWVAGLTGLD
jgi:uncharacterized protein (TIGR02996 family)